VGNPPFLWSGFSLIFMGKSIGKPWKHIGTSLEMEVYNV
jgi:hypothetical protein